MTKKANVSVTILVIGILAVCDLALISFIVSKTSVRESFTGVALMEKMNSQIEDYSFYHDFARVDTKINSQEERVFYQEKKKSFGILFWRKDRVVFSVEYKVP